MKNPKFVIVLTILGLVGLQAEAEPLHPQLTTKHMFIFGGYRQSFDGSFYANRDNLPNANLKIGGLGIDNTESSFMVEYRYRLTNRWMFNFGAYRFDTDGRIEAGTDFTYDGIEYQAGASLDSSVAVDTYMVEALYSVYKTDRTEILLGGGLHLLDFSTSIKTKVFVGDKEITGSDGNDDLLAPLPNFRLQGFYALSSKWALAATVGLLSLDYKDYSGSFTYLHARTTYRFTEKFGASIGYQFVDVEYDHDKTNGQVGLDLKFEGPTITIAYSL
jgi:opacity protein-like surface antigen